MNWKLFTLWTVLASFTVFSAYVIWQHGYVGLFEAALANTATVQASLDLVIALSLVSIWMIGDARSRGVASLPYVLTTLLLGSIGPLLYLIRRERGSAPHALPATGQRATA